MIPTTEETGGEDFDILSRSGPGTVPSIFNIDAARSGVAKRAVISICVFAKGGSPR